jgi:amino acid adenylation domain-containing protein
VWLAEKLRADVPFTNVVNAVRLTGELGVPALAASLREIVRRHQVLRSAVFEDTDSEPAQRVVSTPPLPLPLVDLAGLPAARRERELRGRVEAEARRPFDLGSGLLMRCLLLRLGEREHALVLDLHHIACDGNSLHVLTNELAALYSGQSLPPPPLQYADYAVWERQRQSGPEMAAHLAFWRERLDGCLELALPLDFPRPRQRSFRGGLHRLALPPEVAEPVRDLARRETATVAMVLIAAFQALLGRYAGQEDVAVASPAANRPRPELETLIGTFSNIVVVRTETSPPVPLSHLPPDQPRERGDVAGAVEQDRRDVLSDASPLSRRGMGGRWERGTGGEVSLRHRSGFRGLLGRVRAAVLAAHAHQELSFDRVVEELRPERDPSRHPLVQVMLNFRQAPSKAVELPGVRLERIDLETGGARFDLELSLWEEDGGLSGLLVYGADLFLATTAARFAMHFGRLLAAALAEPERPVAGLPLLAEAEAHQLLHEWNDTSAEIPPGSIVDQVRAVADRRPDAVAVVADRVLTFRDLMEEVDRLAGHLRDQGAGPGARVALFLDRGADLAVAVLAVLAAGSAFVPLDPRYPQSRLDRMLADSGATLALDRERRGGGALSREAGEGRGGGFPAAPAYLIYTSGTTGEPKGVVISRRNLDGYAEALGDRLGIAEDDVYLHTASFAFSSSVRQLLLPLARGARLVVASVDEIADPLALARLARREGVTVLDLVPSYAHGLVEAADRDGAFGDHLRLVLTASEPLPSDLPARWRRVFGRAVSWFNMLGHTETTGIDTVQPMEDEPVGAVAPLGRPLPRRRVHVLDGRLHPVPIGVVGEIATGGDGVGLGYWNRPGLTAELFVPDPWSAEPGARLYRTGDLGRRLPDGTLAFAGRRDHQVKIRGQRVETGEIEAELSRCPGVSRAVVTARAGREGETRLVAYVTPKSLDASGLRRALAERVPPSLVPSAFVLLDALPLTPTGKLDRAALPEPEPAPPSPGREPRTRLEARLAGLWSEVLERPGVGVDDDFFELGGHSLLAVLLLARVREALGVEVSLRAFFARPTVAGMVAEAVDRLIAAAGPTDLAAAAAEVSALADAEVAARLAVGFAAKFHGAVAAP